MSNFNAMNYDIENLSGAEGKELEQIIVEVNEIQKKVSLMQPYILDSTKKIPESNEQLGKISLQTEAAANQMLDMAEDIIDRQQKIGDMARENLSNLNESAISKTEKQYANLHSIDKMSRESHDKAFMIMNALQFQDITSQQLRHVTSLLERVGSRLKKLNSIIAGHNVETEDTVINSKKVFHDPDADYLDVAAQQEVDSIIDETKRKG